MFTIRIQFYCYGYIYQQSIFYLVKNTKKKPPTFTSKRLQIETLYIRVSKKEVFFVLFTLYNNELWFNKKPPLLRRFSLLRLTSNPWIR